LAGDELLGRILVIASSVLKAGKKFFRQKELVRSGGIFTIIEAGHIPITGIGAGKISAAITRTGSGREAGIKAISAFIGDADIKLFLGLDF